MQSALIRILRYFRKLFHRKVSFDIVLQRLELRVKYQWPREKFRLRGHATIAMAMMAVILAVLIITPLGKTVVRSPQKAYFAVANFITAKTIQLLPQKDLPASPKLTVIDINPENSPEKFYLKNPKTGQYQDLYQKKSDANGTTVRTRTDTAAGYQDLVMNGDTTKLYDGAKQVAQAQVLLQKKDADGNWVDVGSPPAASPDPSVIPEPNSSVIPEPEGTPTSGIQNLDSGSSSQPVRNDNSGATDQPTAEPNPAPSPSPTSSPVSLIWNWFFKPAYAQNEPAPTPDPSPSPSPTVFETASPEPSLSPSPSDSSAIPTDSPSVIPEPSSPVILEPSGNSTSGIQSLDSQSGSQPVENDIKTVAKQSIKTAEPDQVQVEATAKFATGDVVSTDYEVKTEGQGEAKQITQKQTFKTAAGSQDQRLVWEIKLTDYNITADSNTVIPDQKDVILEPSSPVILNGSEGSSEALPLDSSVAPQNDKKGAQNDKNTAPRNDNRTYGSTIINCSDYTGSMRWVEDAKTDTVTIYFDEAGTTKDITIDPILAVTTPTNQITVNDGTHTWTFDSSVAGAPKYYYDTHIGGGATNLASTYSFFPYIGPNPVQDGTLSSVTQTLVENTPTRVKIQTQGTYTSSPSAIDNTYTIYPDGRAFLQYSWTLAGTDGVRVVQHYLNADPQIADHNTTDHTFVLGDTANNNYPGMVVVPFTSAEFNGGSGWLYSTIPGLNLSRWYKDGVAGTYTGNMAIDFSNYRATTTTRDALMNEYRTPAALANFVKGVVAGDGFAENEGAYTVTADASGDAKFDLQPGAYPRLKPAITIAAATRTEDSYQVLIGGALKTKGIDYNLSKSDASTVDIQLLSTVSADTTIEVSNGGNNNVWTNGAANGLWSTAGNWSLGNVPLATDNVVFGSATANCSIDATAVAKTVTIAPGYTGIVTAGASLTVSSDFSLEGGTFNTATFALNVTKNFNRVGGTLSGAGAITVTGVAATTTVVNFGNTGTVTWTGILNLNPPATATINLNMGTLTTSGTCGGITVAGTTTGAVVLQDALTMAATKTLTLTSGTLNTNNQAVSVGFLSSSNSNTRTLKLGSSIITITGTSATATAWNFITYTGLTFNADTSAITFTGVMTGSNIAFYGGFKTFYNVTFQGGGAASYIQNATFNNLTFTGRVSATDALFLTGSTVNSTLTINGNNPTNRILVSGGTLGTPNTITAANVVLSNVDFRDITFAGAMAGTATSSSIGDCGGNSGVNWNTTAFPTAATTTTWDGTANLWSSAHWDVRVPLPQDTVVLAGTSIITADMPRLGKDISFSAAARLTLGNAVTSYGSVNFTNAGTFTQGINVWTFESQARSGILDLTSNGKTLYTIYSSTVGATLRLLDSLTSNGQLVLGYGTFDANNFNVTAVYLSGVSATVYMRNGIWTITGTAATSAFNIGAGNTIYSGGSTIVLSGAITGASTFIGAGKTYNNLSITGGGSGAWTFTGANTFNNFTIGAPKTVTFFSGVTTTINGTFTAVGTAGNVITIKSSTAGSAATLSKASGIVVVDYANVNYINVTGGAKWYADLNSTVTNSSGWLTDATAPTNPTTTTATVGATPIVASSWINTAGTITYNFSGSADPDSGIAGYYTYFGPSATGDPTVWQANAADPQTYANAITTADDGKHFYFRVKTKDNVGNIGTAATLFDFGYDITLPTRPTFIAATPAGYTTTNSFSFEWPAATDPVGPGGNASGIKWYEYKRAAVDVAWSHTADATTRTVSGITAYQEGANTFYVRTVDNAGNAGDYQQVTYYFSGVAPAKPTNLAITPDPSDANNLTISWDKSAVGPGDPPVVGYYYSINAAPTIQNVTYVASQADHISIGPDHYATLQGLNTVYVLGKNEAGNYSFEDAYVASKTFTCQTPAPPAPVAVTISDSSNRAYGTYSLTIAWSAADTQDPVAFGHYEIYRSTDGVTFTPLANTGNSTAYIDVSGLDNATTYYYEIKSVDNAGSESAASTIVSKQPIGNYQTPPAVLSTPTVGSINSQSATIAWTTDRVSSSIVRYGTTSGTWTGSSGQYDSTLNHSVILTGLVPDSIYYYQIQSLDEFFDYTAENAYSSIYNFTSAARPAITAVTVSGLTLTSATIGFATTTVSTTKLYYGLTTSYGSQVEDISGTGDTTHSVKLSSLKSGTTYYFKIEGTDVDGNNLSSDGYNFDTLSLPKVTNLNIEPVGGQAQSAFKAQWTTNVATTTNLRYQTAGGQWQESNDIKSTLEHSVTITGLTDNTTYDIIASGRDELGNLAESPTEHFTTPFDTRPPQISAVTIETSMVGSGATLTVQVTVNWTTDESATAQIEYGLGDTGAYTGSSLEETDLVTQRSVIISNLQPSTPYHLHVIAKDKSGNRSESADQIFVTGSGQRSAWDLIKETLFNIFGFWIGKYQ